MSSTWWSKKAFLLAPSAPETTLVLHMWSRGENSTLSDSFDFWTEPELQFSSKLGPTPPSYPPSLPRAERERTQEGVGSGGGGVEGKAWAQRFAGFSHNFSLLLLHKKRGIPDYLWHSETVRVDTQRGDFAANVAVQ